MDGIRAYIATLAIPWEGTYVDLWSIAHTIFGFVAAYIFRRFQFRAWSGFWLTLVLAIVWEIVERITGIAAVETIRNSCMDIIVALVGYGLATWFMDWHNDDSKLVRSVMVVAVILFVLIFVLRQLAPGGWWG